MAESRPSTALTQSQDASVRSLVDAGRTHCSDMARFNSSTSFANFAESFSWVTSAAISRQGRLGRETAGFNITDPLEATFSLLVPTPYRASVGVRSGSFDPLSPESGQRSRLHQRSAELSLGDCFERSDCQTRGESGGQYQGERDRTTGKIDRSHRSRTQFINGRTTAQPAAEYGVSVGELDF